MILIKNPTKPASWYFSNWMAWDDVLEEYGIEYMEALLELNREFPTGSKEEEALENWFRLRKSGDWPK